MRLTRLFASLVFLSLGSCVSVPASAPAAAVSAEAPFVIAANPLAARAGLNVLKRGGSAVDAAIAVQAMLSLVEPQSSGIGGGAFMTYYDPASRKVSVYDGREIAPAQASSTMFLDETGKPLPFDTAVLSGRATGVLGAIKMLAMAHGEHGKLPWNSLFDDARSMRTHLGRNRRGSAHQSIDFSHQVRSLADDRFRAGGGLGQAHEGLRAQRHVAAHLAYGSVNCA